MTDRGGNASRRPIALDTNTDVGCKRGDPVCLEVFMKADRLQISGTVLRELLAGFACGSQEARHREEPRRFLALPSVAVTPVGLSTADSDALIDRTLRQQGRPIPTNDLWIAASRLEQGALLLSLEAHFAAVPGLRWIRQWAEVLP